MTGRELILYILSNNLEDEPVFKDGKFIGCMDIWTAAAKMGVGPATIIAWADKGKLKHVILDDGYYIFANQESPMKDQTNK